MPEIQTFKDLGIKEDEFRIEVIDADDGGALVEIYFESDEAEEIFKNACERAGLTTDQYLRALFLPE
jgi:hypothetical protein